MITLFWRLHGMVTAVVAAMAAVGSLQQYTIHPSYTKQQQHIYSVKSETATRRIYWVHY